MPMKAALLSLALLSSATPATAEIVSGPGHVIDGDTLQVEGRRVRLFGIDAPELSQTCDRSGERWACGEASAEQLRSLIGGYPVSCEGNEVDVYSRLLAVCSLSGVSLNRTMVAEGWATAFRRYSEDYVTDERVARARRLGLWSSTFAPPEDYRRTEDANAGSQQTQRLAGRPASSSSPRTDACLIKGNRNKRGEWIYHLPGRPYYAETRAEQMFCSEADAIAAGYRRSKA